MSSISSDSVLRAVLALAGLAMALTMVLAALIVALRLRLRRRQRHAQEFAAKWRPVLMAAVADPAGAVLPPLQRRDEFAFLKLWNYLHESLRGNASEHLNALARRLHCDESATRMLAGGDRAGRLLAILTIGHLRERSAWHALRAAAAARDGVMSLMAARALIQIDGRAGAECLLPFVLARRDWEIPRLARMLEPARAAFQVLIIQALRGLPAERLLRALQLAEALRMELPQRSLGQLMQAGQPPEVVAAALRLVSHPSQLPAVKAQLDHPQWRVRVEAIHALGRLGQAADVRALSRLLDDDQWWVRYRAAHTLISSPLLEPAELAELCAAAHSAHAAGVLAHAMAERRLS